MERIVVTCDRCGKEGDCMKMKLPIKELHIGHEATIGIGKMDICLDCAKKILSLLEKFEDGGKTIYPYRIGNDDED